MKKNMFESINTHQDNKNLHECYRNKDLFRALEYADRFKDWITFRTLFSYYPEYLKNQLNLTRNIIDYNCFKLSKEEQMYLFCKIN